MATLEDSNTTDSTIKERLRYYNETGTLLSQGELEFYNSTDPEFLELRVLSENQIQEDLELQFEALQEGEKALFESSEQRAELQANKQELEAKALELEIKALEMEALAAKLSAENIEMQNFNLDMERLTSESSLKMTSLGLVLGMITILLVGCMLLFLFEVPTPESFILGIMSLSSALIGGFLTSLLTGAKQN